MYEYMETGVRLTGFNEEMPYRWTADTVSSILEREDYIGNTVNCRYTKLSFKDKKRVERPECEHIRIEHSHEAIIDDETWRLVQKLRANKRRPKKMDGLDKYSGLLFCEDCGSKMYFMRGRTIKPEAFCFVCSKYHKHNTVEKCTPHTIRSGVLDSIVLEEMNRAVRYARSNKEQFIEAAMQKSTAQAWRELAALQSEYNTLMNRKNVLSTLFKRLYEDNIIGCINDEQFRMLSWTILCAYNGEIPIKSDRRYGFLHISYAPDSYSGITSLFVAAESVHFLWVMPCGGVRRPRPTEPR